MSDNKALASQIITAFDSVTSKEAKEDNVWVKEQAFDSANQAKNQLVFFMKPESTAKTAGVKVANITEFLLDKLSENKIEIAQVRVLGAGYLDKNNIIAQHYGVINTISRLGKEALSEAQLTGMFARPEFAEYKDAKVVGGHQFLAEVPDISAAVLSILSDNVRPTRLGPGTYAMPMKANGNKYIVLSPFHPQQLVPFTSPGNAIIVFECLSELNWADLRTKVCGATNPLKAVEGSCRQLLLARKEEFGLAVVDQGNNGVHMSAGPLEGLVEFKRFFSKTDAPAIENSQTCFGALLQSKEITDEQINVWAENIKINVDSKEVSTFDATEEIDASAAVTVLLAAAEQAE